MSQSKEPTDLSNQVINNLQVRDPVDVDRHEVDNFSGGGVFLAGGGDFEGLSVDGGDKGGPDADSDVVHFVKVAAQADGLEGGGGHDQDGIKHSFPHGLVVRRGEGQDLLEQERGDEHADVVDQLEARPEQEPGAERLHQRAEHMSLQQGKHHLSNV